MKQALQRINTIGGYKISFIIFIFCLLFAPPIIPSINVGLIASFVALVLLIFKYKGQLFETLKKSGILKFSVIFAVFLAYLALVTVVNYFIIGERVQLMHYIKLWYRFFLIMPMLTASSAYICIRAKELKYDIKKLCMCFVYATLLQFVLVMLSLIFPEIKALFIKTIYLNTGDWYLSIPWVVARRGFGFTNSFVDSFGWGMGLIAVIPLFFIRKNNMKPALLCPILLFVSLVNARTGLIMLFIGMLFVLPLLYKIYRNSTRKEKLYGAGMVIAAVAILIVLCLIIFIFNPVTLQWIVGDLVSFVPENSETPSALQEMLNNLADDSQTTTAEVLFSDRFWNLPSGYIIGFGSGHSIFGAEGYPNSDVGYINDLWMGGIVGCILLYGAFFFLFKKAFKSVDSFALKALVLFLAACLAVFQIKANAISFCAGLNITLPILFFICFQKKQPEQKHQDFLKSQDDKVSVIVPIYNVSQYIDRCIESIQNQSYENLEIILVNDGSTDQSGDACDKFAANDERIIVIHKQNGGLSDARNVGIDKATGEYIAFVDGDDFLHKDFILALITASKNNSADVAACGHTLYYSEKLQFPTNANGDDVFSTEQAIKDIFTDKKVVDVMAWNKLYKADLFKSGTRYPVGKVHEDVATTYKLLSLANKVAFVNLPFYYYVQRKDSIVNQPFNEKRLALLDIIKDIEPFVQAHPEYNEEYKFYVFLNHLLTLNAMALSNYKDKAYLEKMRADTLNYYKNLSGCPYIRGSHKLTYITLKLGMPIYKNIRKLFQCIKFIRGVIS